MASLVLPSLTASRASLLLPSLQERNPEPDHGIIRSAIDSITSDFVGAGRTVAALGFSPFEALGASVPISLEDLTTKDLKGAGMLAALAAGGVVSSFVRGVPIVARGLQLGWKGRALASAGAEAVAGAAFGLVRPLEEGEDRMKAVYGDIALFSAFGAGASMVKSATSRVIGGFQASLKSAEATKQWIDQLRLVEEEKTARELVGVKLGHEFSDREVNIYRSVKDPKVVELLEVPEWAEAQPVVRSFSGESAFDDALSAAAQDGFLHTLGPLHTPTGVSLLFGGDPALKGALGVLAETGVGQAAGGEAGATALAAIRVSEYKGARAVARQYFEAEAELTHQGFELMTESVNDLGQTSLTKDGRAALIQELRDAEGFVAPELQGTPRKQIVQGLAVTPQKRAALLTAADDTELVRLAIEQGRITVPSIYAGSQINRFMKELVYNDLLPVGFGESVIVNPAKDAFMAKLVTSKTMAKLFPAVRPLVEDLDRRAAWGDIRHRQAKRDLDLLMNKLGPDWKDTGPRAQQAMAIIDGSADKALAEMVAGMGRDLTTMKVEDFSPQFHEAWIKRAKAHALADAKATGDDKIVTAVQGTTDFLDQFLTEFKETGILKRGVPGYMPIVNVGQWRLGITNLPKGSSLTEFQGYFGTQEEAQAALKKLIAEHPEVEGLTHVITANRLIWHADAMLRLAPKDFPEITKEFLEAAKAGTGNILGPRRLGMRSFQRIGMVEALQIYSGNASRILSMKSPAGFIHGEAAAQLGLDAASGFADQAALILESLPEQQQTLKAWAQQLIDDATGAPRQSEKTFQALMEIIKPNVAPRALRRYSAAIRSWESFSRLGNFWSPIVNMTQLAVNTVPVLGPRWTYVGMKQFLEDVGSNESSAILKAMARHNVDIDTFIDLTGQSGVPGLKEAAALVKSGKPLKAIQQALLTPFKSVERMNRMVTWWGAFRREAAKEGITEEMAARTATEVMERTQFNYRISNLPELLRGPAGAVLLQFKSFFINQLEFMASLSKKEALAMGVMAHSMGGLALLTHVPGPDLLSSAKSLYFDTTLEEDMTLAATNGFRDWAFFGVPGLMNRLDLSDSVGMGGFGELARGILGPAASDVVALQAFMKDAVADIGTRGKVTAGTYTSLFGKISPTVARRIYLGYQVMQTGEVRNMYTGKLIYRPADRLRATAASVVGPRLLDTEQQRTMDAVTERIRDRWTKARTGYAKDAAKALSKGDNARAQDIIARARGSGYPIDNSVLRYWIKEMKTTAAERRLGRTPRTLRNREDLQAFFEATGDIPREARLLVR